MDYNVRLSNSKQIFRSLLTDEYQVTGEKVDVLLRDCENSLKARPPSPLYDVIFHRVIREVLDSHHFPYTYIH